MNYRLYVGERYISQCIREFHVYTSCLHEEGKLYYFKSDLTAGIFNGLCFVELDDSAESLTYFLVYLSTSS